MAEDHNSFGSASESAGGGSDVTARLASLDSVESRRVFQDDDDPVLDDDEDEEEEDDDDDGGRHRTRLDSEDEDDNAEQRLVRTGPRMDSFDVKALEIPGAHRNDYEMKSLGKGEEADLEKKNFQCKESMGNDDLAQRSYRGSFNNRQIGVRNSVFESTKIVILSKINVLFPFGILAIVVDKVSGNHGLVFFFSLLGIIPMAERLDFVTRQLAFFTEPTVEGLLNFTFGNATELIISIFALKRGMIRVVQQSLLGSILSNMLLVLVCAFFSGGFVIVKREQVFNKGAAMVSSSLLLMSVMGLLFPAVLHSTRTELHFGKSELALSRFSSCVMLVAYAAYLYFQLKSSKDLYDPVVESPSADEEEGPKIRKWEAIIWFLLLTNWIAVLSEYLVDAIEGASTEWKIPVAFISVILLPIVGNAAEHAGVIMFAMKDKLDISLGVAIGSSTQIAMFRIPFLVVVGWIIGCPMDLNFQLFETATLFITVLAVAFMLQEGTSNYFKGLMLILCYLIVAASFFVHMDPTSIADSP